MLYALVLLLCEIQVPLLVSKNEYQLNSLELTEFQIKQADKNCGGGK